MRYEKINKARETLTRQDKFDNWIKYGDPDGSKSIQALKLAMPNWILAQDFRPKLYTILVTGIIGLLLAI